MKLFVVCLVVLAALRAAASERPLAVQLELPSSVQPHAELHAVEAAGESALVRGRTAGWLLLGGGVGVGALGGWMLQDGLVRGRPLGQLPAGSTLAGVGVISFATGVLLLWTTGHTGSARPLVDRRPLLPQPPRESLAGLDPKRGSDKGTKLPMLGWKF